MNLKIFESTFYNSLNLPGNSISEIKDKIGEEDIRYLIERREKYLPRVKGYFGVNFRSLEFEVGTGYPQVFSFGVGYRFKI